MHRLLRLATLWLIALALPLQGALAASAMSAQAAATVHAAMALPHGHAMAPAAMPGAPCHGHAADKAGGCGDCCGPIVAQQAMLVVVPVAARWSALPRPRAAIGAWPFLTGGTDRPPRPFLA